MMKKFLKKIQSLDNICQWAERDSVIKESVSQHSFKVSSICVYILEKISQFEVPTWKYGYDWSEFSYRCLKYALFHDFDESIIGRDISHVVKYNEFNGQEIRNSLKEYVNHEIEKMKLDFLIHDENTDIKLFVKLCDWISLLTFIQRNKQFGANCFEEEEETCKKNIEDHVELVEETLYDLFRKKFNVKSIIRVIYEQE